MDLIKLAGLTGHKLVVTLNAAGSAIESVYLNGIKVETYTDYVTFNTSPSTITIKEVVNGGIGNVIINNTNNAALTVDWSSISNAVNAPVSVQVNDDGSSAIKFTGTTGNGTLVAALKYDPTSSDIAGIYWGKESDDATVSDLGTSGSGANVIYTDLSKNVFLNKATVDGSPAVTVDTSSRKVTNLINGKVLTVDEPIGLVIDGTEYSYFVGNVTTTEVGSITWSKALLIADGKGSIDLSGLSTAQKLDVINSENIIGYLSVKGSGTASNTLTGATLEGGSAADVLTAGYAKDSTVGASLAGGAGEDILIAGKNNDTLDGGASDGDKDTFVFTKDSGENTIQNFGTEDIIELKDAVLNDVEMIVGSTDRFKSGNTTVIFNSALPTSFKVKYKDGEIGTATFATNVAYTAGVKNYKSLALNGGSITLGADITKPNSIWLDNDASDLKLSNINSVDGSAATGSLNIRGNEANNSLIGGDAADEIWGGGKGSNTLKGGNGADNFWVGAGEDNLITDYKHSDKDKIMLFDYDFADKTLDVSWDSALNKTTIAVGDKTAAVLSDNGASASDIAGQNASLIIRDKNGKEKLVRVSNASSAEYDNSSDIYYLGAGAMLVDNSGDSDITIRSNDLWLNKAGTGDADIFGGKGFDFRNSLVDNYLHGDSGSNSIVGGDGNDQLWGGAGGNNTLEGGAGFDEYWFGFEAGKTIIDGFDEDDDTIVLYADNLQDVVVSNATTDLSMKVEGKNGELVLKGFSGDITLNVRDVTGETKKLNYSTLTGSAYEEGVNIYYGSGDFTVEANTAAADIWLDSLNGQTAAYGFNNIDASKSAVGNYLHGTTGNNSIVGGYGDDEIWGGAGGNNTLEGGAGADTFFVTNEGNQVTQIRDGSSLDKVLFYNTGLTDLNDASVNAYLDDSKALVISLSSTTLKIDNFKDGSNLNTFCLGGNDGITDTYQYDVATEKFIKK